MDALDHGEGFLRLKQVLERIPVSKRAWYRGMKAGKYPLPIKLGPRTTVWRVEDIRDLINGVCNSSCPRKEDENREPVASRSETECDRQMSG